MLKRKRIPAELEEAHAAFEAALAHVERAKEGLVSAVPTARAPGRPLAEAPKVKKGLVSRIINRIRGM